MNLRIVEEGVTHTVYAHEDEYMPEENHTESILRQTTHFHSQEEAEEFAEEWGMYLGRAEVVEFGGSCPCPFCKR